MNNLTDSNKGKKRPKNEQFHQIWTTLPVHQHWLSIWYTDKWKYDLQMRTNNKDNPDIIGFIKNKI